MPPILMDAVDTGFDALPVPRGATLAVVGGDIRIDGASASPGGAPTIVNEGGSVELAAVRAAGIDVPVDVASFDARGQAAGALGEVSLGRNALVDVGAPAGAPVGPGRVVVRAGRLVVDDARIQGVAASNVAGEAVAIDLEAAEAVEIRGGSQLTVRSATAASAAGDVRIAAEDVHLGGGALVLLRTGIDHSCGDVIVLMDADLQNDPADIPLMLDKIEQGYDVVSGWRVNRQDKFLTRVLPSRMANGLISFVTGVHLHDYGCTLKAYRREVLTGFRLYGEMHRFIPAYAHSVGAKMAEMKVQHHPRRFGKTKYGLTRTLKVILDLFTVKFLISYANKPIYLFGGAGLVLMAGSGLTLVYLIIRRLLIGTSVTRSPYLPITIMFFSRCTPRSERWIPPLQFPFEGGG